MVSLDIFHQDAFRTITLTTAIEKVPYLPSALLDMGIFEDDPIRTEALAVEERLGQLFIVPFSDRGASGTQRTTEQRKIRFFQVPRIRAEDTIYARELAAIRQFGTETELMQVQAELARRTVGPTGLRSQLAFTQEYHRLAALQGKLLDADGSVKFDWFAEFGITAPAEIVFNLPAKTAGSLRPLLNLLIRAMKRGAQGAWIEGRTRAAALTGDAFFDALVTHPDVEKTYLNWQQAAELRKNQAFEVFNWGGVDWINYRGSDDTLGIAGTTANANNVVTAITPVGVTVGMQVSGPGIPAGTTVAGVNLGASTVTLSANATVAATNILNFGGGNTATGGGAIAVPSNKAKFFPRGAPGVFKRGLAPADSFEWVNSLGKPEYLRIIPDRDRDEWVKAEMTVHPLHICTRPAVLQTGTMDATAD